MEITVPPGTKGILRLLLLDSMKGYRKERLVVQGKTIGEYAKFGSPGKEVAVPISAEDAKSGKINLSIVNLRRDVERRLSASAGNWNYQEFAERKEAPRERLGPKTDWLTHQQRGRIFRP